MIAPVYEYPHSQGLSRIAQDSSGRLYLMSITTGNLYRLQP